jgi:hypothetical protein
MKTQTKFENASLVSVVNGSIVVKSAAGIEHTFTNASIVSVNNGTIIIRSEWRPKNGELVKAIGCNIDSYIIFQCMDNMFLYTHGFKGLCNTFVNFLPVTWIYNEQLEILPVTPEEQKEFDDLCKSQGKIWNKETLQWEKYKWKPELGATYYYVDLEFSDSVGRHCYTNACIDQCNYEHYNCFQTKKQAQEAAKKVKELLKSL